MLKFIKGHMTSLDGVEWYPIITLIIFMLIFVGAIYLALRAKRPYLDEMEQLPLEDGSKQPTQSGSIA